MMTVQQAFEAMFTEQSTEAHVLGDRVREASRHRGPWPKISIWHGMADPIVKPSNAEDIIRQWTNVHNISVAPSYEESIGSHTRRVWRGADSEALIEAFSISGMAHGVPLATTMGDDSCGAAGAFFLDAGISSTHHIASFWGVGSIGDGVRAVRPGGRDTLQRHLHACRQVLATSASGLLGGLERAQLGALVAAAALA